MAKQAGDFFIEGTVDDLTFYRMCGDYYVRTKSSLTGKRFWKDTAFGGSRKSCSRFAKGNRLASRVYAMIEEDKRVYQLFCFLKRRSIQLLKEGWSIQEAEELLIDYLIEFGLLRRERGKNIRDEHNCTTRAVSQNEEVKMISFLVNNRLEKQCCFRSRASTITGRCDSGARFTVICSDLLNKWLFQ